MVGADVVFEIPLHREVLLAVLAPEAGNLRPPDALRTRAARLVELAARARVARLHDNRLRQHKLADPLVQVHTENA